MLLSPNLTCTSALVGSLLLLLQVASATTCGKWYSSDCLGKTDRRYNPEFTLDLTELAPFWKQWEGLWIVDDIVFVDPVTGVELEPSFNPAFAGNQPLSTLYYLRSGFYNETFTGSRYQSNRYYVFEKPSEEFCLQPVPPGLTNVLGSGTCGVNGYSYQAGSFGTTTYEKDGVIDVFRNFGMYNARGSDSLKLITRFTPVDDRTMTQIATDAEDSAAASPFITSLTYSFVQTYTEMVGTQSTFSTRGGSALIARRSAAFTLRKVTEDEWLAALETAYVEFNVLEADRIQNGTLPTETECLALDGCPTEEEWCEADPACSEQSPYQEPSASLKAGPIVGIVMASVVLLFIAAYFYFRHQMAKQAARYRRQFAARVAETIDLRASAVMMTPEALGKEFHKIASNLEGDGGCITKVALWDFVSSGKAGEMDKADFNAMFATLDADGDGKADFFEFCNFMSVCGEDFDAARAEMKKNRKHPNRLTQAALQLSSTASVRRSQLLNQKVIAKELGEEYDEEEYDEEDDVPEKAG